MTDDERTAEIDVPLPDAWRDERTGNIYVNQRKHSAGFGMAFDGDSDCTPLYLSVLPPAESSWARQHARENPGHRTREGLDDPGSCADCGARSPIYDLAATRPIPPAKPEASQ